MQKHGNRRQAAPPFRVAPFLDAVGAGESVCAIPVREQPDAVRRGRTLRRIARAIE